MGAGRELSAVVRRCLRRRFWRVGSSVQTLVGGGRLVSQHRSHCRQSGQLGLGAPLLWQPIVLRPFFWVHNVDQVGHVVGEGAQHAERLDGLVPGLQAVVED